MARRSIFGADILPYSFYERSALLVAPELLGNYIIHECKDGISGGMIVETEAYLQNDTASHSLRGETARNRAMFGPAGHLYIYRIYGKHLCINATTGKEGNGEAVLIRAIEPVWRMTQATNGPAKLTAALGITMEDYGKSLIDSDIRIVSEEKQDFEIGTSKRVGLTRGIDKMWRYYIKGNPFISRKGL